MKSRTAISLFLAGVCLTTLAAAQNQPASEKKDPLSFVQTAADIANNLRHESLDGYLGIYVDAKTWAAAMKDGDLGPFLKPQEGKPDRSAACFFSGAKDAGVCVYFDGEKAYGATAVHAPAGGKIEDKDIASAYKIVTKEMLEKSGAKMRFAETEVSTDDGVPLPSYLVSVLPVL